MKIAGSACLVLGAGGFMGTNLCLGLRAAGAHVEAYGRRPRDTDVLDDLVWHDRAFADADSVAAAVSDKDFVFHLLGGSTPALSNVNPATDIVDSLLPSVRMIEACHRAGVHRLLFASSGGTVYGRTASDPLRESAPTDPITAYGINKLAVEKYLGLFRALHGLDSIALRISNPYGPHQHMRRSQGVVGAMLTRAIRKEPIDIWNDGSVVRDFIHVDDVVDALIAAAEYAGSERTFNVGSGIGRSLRDVAFAICDVTGRDRDTIRYSSGRPEDVPVNVLDTTLFRHETGWSPGVEWIAGLAATAIWIRTCQAPPVPEPSESAHAHSPPEE